jgi:hypothetical protein
MSLNKEPAAGEEGRVPPLVSPLFVIEVAHWGEWYLNGPGREGEKSGTARGRSEELGDGGGNIDFDYFLRNQPRCNAPTVKGG